MRIRISITIALLVTFAAMTYWAYDAGQLYVLRAGNAGTLTYNLLFNTAALMIPVAALLGIFLGAFKYYKHQEKFVNGKIERHDEFMFIQHWSNALGFVVLIITGLGLGTLFIPRTFQGAEQIGFALNMHFVGIIFSTFGISFYITKNYFTGELKHMLPKKGDLKGMIGHYTHMLFRKGEAPKEEKFLHAERLVFPMWIIGLSGIFLTGIVKILAHVWVLSAGLMGVMTFLHGVFAIFLALMLVAHVFAAAIIPPSWPLLWSMITGKVTEIYVKHHHEKWYDEIEKSGKSEDSIKKHA